MHDLSHICITVHTVQQHSNAEQVNASHNCEFASFEITQVATCMLKERHQSGNDPINDGLFQSDDR